MKKIKMLFLIYPILMIMATAYAAGSMDKVNFGNYTTVKDVVVKGDKIIFETTDGFAECDKFGWNWSYSSRSYTAETSHGNVFNNEYSFKNWPKWLPQKAYSKIICADNYETPGYFIVKQINEGGNCDYDELVRLSDKKVFRIDCGSFSSLKVDNNIAWMGGTDGVYRLDMKTNHIEKYVTTPPCNVVVGFGQLEDKVYYADKDYGVFCIDKKTERIEPVYAFLHYDQESKARCSLMHVAAEKLFAFSNVYSGVLWNASGNGTLLVYDVLKKERIEIDTGVSYVDSVKIAGDEILFYGTERQNSAEGDFPGDGGGAFLYNIKTGMFRRIASMHISCLSSDKDGYKTLTIGEETWEDDEVYTYYIEGFLDVGRGNITPTKAVFRKSDMKYSKTNDPELLKQKRLNKIASAFGYSYPDKIKYEVRLVKGDETDADWNQVRKCAGLLKGEIYTRQKSYKTELSKLMIVPEVMKLPVGSAEEFKY